MNVHYDPLGSRAPVRIAQDGDVLSITLDRPDALNALSDATLDGLHTAVDEAECADARVAVLRGEGRAFCAGADVLELREALAANPARDWGGQRREAGRWNRLFERLDRIPQVLVGALHGPVVGGGVILATCCDLRVAAPNLRLWIPEVAIGRPLTWGGNPRLVREIGLSRARELVMTARELTADDALAWGLVHRVGDLEVETARLVESLVAMPAAPLEMTKASFRAYGQTIVSDALAWPDADILDGVTVDKESRRATIGYVERFDRARGSRPKDQTC